MANFTTQSEQDRGGMHQVSGRRDLRKLLSEAEIENAKRIQEKEDRLKNLIGPIESYIRQIECVLTWDYPIVFILLVVLVHILFLLFSVARSMLVISICGFIGLFAYIITALLCSSESEESTEGWVQIQSREEGQFDLIHCISCIIIKFEDFYSSCMKVKSTDRDKFCIIGITLCFALYIVSCFISDIIFLYSLVMFILFWPGLKHNKLTDKFVAFIIPYIVSVEKTFHIKRTVNRKKFKRQMKKKLRKNKGDERQSEEEEADGEDADDSDADLKEFIPSEDSFLCLTDDKANEDKKVNSLYNDDEDDSDTGEFLPKTSIVSDSRDASDEEFLPNESSFFSKAKDDTVDSLEPSTDLKPQFNVGDTENDIFMNDEIVRASQVHSKEKTNETDEHNADDGFTDGLSFDNADNESVDVKDKNASSVASYLIGGLFDPSTVTNNVPDAAAAVIHKAFSGFNVLKNTLGLVMGSASSQPKPDEVASNKDSQMVDNEFDFLQQEDLDDFDDD